MISNQNCRRMRAPSCPVKYPEQSFPPAMAYVPWQTFTSVYDPEKAFCQGTVFPELDKPFCGNGGCR